MKRPTTKTRRLTKADKYNARNVQYKDNKVQTPLGNWVALPLKEGNTKVGKAVKTWSIMHGNELYTIDNVGSKVKEVMDLYHITECKGSCEFHCDHCYCDNGFYTMCNDAYASAVQWLTLYRMYPDWVERTIIAQIQIEGITQVRVHAQGDFNVDSNYIDMWCRICRACPNTKFWTYTKIDSALTAFDDVPNMFITPSITPYGFNFGTCEYLLDTYDKLTRDGYRVHICRCGGERDGESKQHCEHCNHGCKSVGVDTDYVLFILHSTKDYKAGKKDPAEYGKVRDIIARQNND